MVPGYDRVRNWVIARWRDPVAWTELIQIVKIVVATVASWVIAIQVFSLPQAFLAPWSALLVVNTTVLRTFAEGARQITAAVIGVLLAWAIGNLLGLDLVSLGLLVMLGLVVGYLPKLGLDGIAVASTGVIVLTIRVADQDHLLLARLADTAIGIVVGLLVNLVVWPPLRDFSAARAIDAVDTEVGVLLRDIASELRDACQEENVADWVDRTRDIDESIDQAWALVRQARESGKFNPRRGAREVRRPGEYGEVLHRIEQAVAETRSMARTLGHSISNVNTWEDRFRETWVDLLDATGTAIAEADPDGVAAVREQLGDLADEMSTERLPGLLWTEYGGLIVNLRNIVAAMHRVARSNPVTPETDGRLTPMLRG